MQNVKILKEVNINEQNTIKVTKTNDNIINVDVTGIGHIGCIIESQIDKAISILKHDVYGIGFYNKLNS